MATCDTESRPSNLPFFWNLYSNKIKIPCRQDFLSKSQSDYLYSERTILGPNIQNTSCSLTLIKDDQYELRTATFPQIIQAIINGSIEWEDDYPSKKDYLKLMIRMLMLSQIAQHVVFYILVPKEAPENTLEFLAHCMVYKREAYSKHINSSSIDIVPVWTVSYVFVPTKYRGSGHGKQILKALQEYMTLKGISLSILYSDIGTDFYSKMQWNPIQNTEWIFQIQRDINIYDLPISKTFQNYTIMPVNLYTIEYIIKKDKERLFKEMNMNTNSQPLFSIIPTVENLECDYLDMISKYSAKNNISLQSAALSIVCGAIIYPDSIHDDKEISYVLWNVDVSLQTLLITRLYAFNQSSFEFITKDLITLAASYYGMKQVIMWEQSCPSDFSHLMPAFGYSNRQIKERIPCLYHHSDEYKSTPIWLHNELFFWF